MKKIALSVVSLFFLFSGAAAAEESSWLQIGGDYRYRIDSLKGSVHDYVQFDPTTGTFTAVPGYTVKNDTLMTNRFGLNLKADVADDVAFKLRLAMYKVWGHETSGPFSGTFFADRLGAMDGTSTHVPQDNTVRVDYGYVTISNIFDEPVWFSIGRRPSTGGLPGTLRQNQEKIGTAGIPSILVDYAFDGLTLGVAPDIEALPGAYAKLCYGRGFDSGFQSADGGLKDMDFLGLDATLLDTEKLHVELQYQNGSNIFDHSSDPDEFGEVTANLGDIHWLGGVVVSKLGALNLFVSAAASKTDPNDNTNPMGAGLLWDSFNAKESRTGNAVYLGARYDIPSSRTKIGLEYNHGSKNWIGMVPAGDDVWTSKLGTRGDVYEIYLIQELNRKPVAKKGTVFIRTGFQYYKFDYTGSNSWLGSPVKNSELNLNTSDMAKAQFLTPLKNAQDIYATLEVRF